MISKRTYKTAFWFAALVAVLLVPWSSRVTIPAVIEAQKLAPIHAPVAAVVEAVHVARGARVKQGDILAELSSPATLHELKEVNIQGEIVSLRQARRASDGADRGEAVILDQEYQSLIQSKHGLEQQLNELKLKAPFSGEVVEMMPALLPERWVSPKDAVVLIRSADIAEVQGSIDGSEIWRIEAGSSARFIPDDLALKSLDVTLTSISQTASQVLPRVELAHSYGGRIATTLDQNRMPVPATAHYAIRAEIIGTVPPAFLQKTVTGVVVANGRRESLAARFWRQALKVLVRESGL